MALCFSVPLQLNFLSPCLHRCTFHFWTHCHLVSNPTIAFKTGEGGGSNFHNIFTGDSNLCSQPSSCLHVRLVSLTAYRRRAPLEHTIWISVHYISFFFSFSSSVFCSLMFPLWGRHLGAVRNAESWSHPRWGGSGSVSSSDSSAEASLRGFAAHRMATASANSPCHKFVPIFLHLHFHFPGSGYDPILPGCSNSSLTGPTAWCPIPLSIPSP